MSNKPSGPGAFKTPLNLFLGHFTHLVQSNTLPLFTPKYGTLQGQWSSLGILQFGWADLVLDALSKRSAYQCDKGRAVRSKAHGVSVDTLLFIILQSSIDNYSQAAENRMGGRVLARDTSIQKFGKSPRNDYSNLLRSRLLQWPWCACDFGG